MHSNCVTSSLYVFINSNQYNSFFLLQNAGLSSIPFICNWIMSIVYSNRLDWAREKGWISTTFARKLSMTIGEKILNHYRPEESTQEPCSSIQPPLSLLSVWWASSLLAAPVALLLASWLLPLGSTGPCLPGCSQTTTTLPVIMQVRCISNMQNKVRNWSKNKLLSNFLKSNFEVGRFYNVLQVIVQYLALST